MSDVCRKVVQAAQKGGYYYVATAAADHEMRVKKEKWIDTYLSWDFNYFPHSL